MMVSTLPHRANGMNHITGWQPEACGQLCLTGFTTIERATGLQQLWACRTMYRTINTTASQQTMIGGVDDGINIKRSYISLYHLNHNQPVPVEIC
jgi:hypothetical protein